MTLNTQLSNEHKIHRIHQHLHHQDFHHHYHVHHLLHHHQHINEQITQSHLHSLNDHDHNYNHKQLQPIGKTNQIVAPAEKNRQFSTIASRRHLARSNQRAQIRFFLVAAFAYILSPIDLIPEAIFGIFGILDDLLFLFMCLMCVAIILVYPIFREMQRTIFDKLGLIEGQAITNKSF